eukprot:gene5341-9150_t
MVNSFGNRKYTKTKALQITGEQYQTFIKKTEKTNKKVLKLKNTVTKEQINFIQELLSEDTKKSTKNNFNIHGKYKLRDGKKKLTGNLDGISERFVERVCLKNGELTMKLRNFPTERDFETNYPILKINNENISISNMIILKEKRTVHFKLLDAPSIKGKYPSEITIKDLSISNKQIYKYNFNTIIE